VRVAVEGVVVAFLAAAFLLEALAAGVDPYYLIAGNSITSSLTRASGSIISLSALSGLGLRLLHSRRG
jgi:hypothetical protein